MHKFLASLLLSLSLAGPWLAAAEPVQQAAEGASATEAYAIEHILTEYAFEADGTGERKVSSRVHVLSDAGVQAFAVLHIAYDQDSETVKIDYVRVIKPDGTVVVTPAENVQDMTSEITLRAPVYSDLRIKHVTVKGLASGDILETAVSVKVTKARVPGHFWSHYNFLREVVCNDEQFVLRVPKDTFANVKSREVEPTIRDEGRYRIYTWKTSNPKPRNRDRRPRVEMVPRDTPAPSVEVTTFRSWDDIGKWYAGLLRDRITVTPEVRAKALEITKGADTDREKIRLLYEYVATQIHYVGLSFGIGRYQPHAASEVLNNGYGDCKDKHTLLAALLKAVNVPAGAVLINSRRDVDADFPSPGDFDHVITRLHAGNDVIWLDTTEELGPFEYLMGRLRDRHALVVTDNGSALLQTPTQAPFREGLLFDAKGELGATGTLTARMQWTTRGDRELMMRLGFRRTPRSRWEELIQDISYAAYLRGSVSNLEAMGPEDTHKPFQVSYDFRREHYSDFDTQRIIAPMPAIIVEAMGDEETPTEALRLGPPSEVILHAKVALPPGFSVRVPPNVNLDEPFVSYRSSYSATGGVLEVERRLVIKRDVVPISDWPAYHKFAKVLEDDQRRYILLMGPGGAGPTVVGAYRNVEVGISYRPPAGWTATQSGTSGMPVVRFVAPDRPASVTFMVAPARANVGMPVLLPLEVSDRLHKVKGPKITVFAGGLSFAREDYFAKPEGTRAGTYQCRLRAETGDWQLLITATASSKEEVAWLVATLGTLSFSPPRPPSGALAESPVTVDGAVMEKNLIRRAEPQYPALVAGRHGYVLLQVTIGKDGKVKSVEPVSGDSMLQPAVVEAVKTWEYKPYLLQGEPVEVTTLVSVSKAASTTAPCVAAGPQASGPSSRCR